MPAWTTPELWPVWWAATRYSFSSTTTRVPGRRRTSSRAIASPTMPPPTTPTVSSPMGRNARLSGLLRQARPWRAGPSDVEAELHHVAVGHDVVLALHAHLAGRLGGGHGPGVHQVVVGDDLGLDEA